MAGRSPLLARSPRFGVAIANRHSNDCSVFNHNTLEPNLDRTIQVSWQDTMITPNPLSLLQNPINETQ